MTISRALFGSVAVLALLACSACTTLAAKKAMSRPPSQDHYSGFDKDANEQSKRPISKPDPIKEDTEPEKAVATLVEQLQKDRPSAISAEEQLKWWGAKQGIGEIVVRQVRMLLKNPLPEVRAPALRLTILFGTSDSAGDLIECLADDEYGMRATAFRTLKNRTQMDFGYDPSGGVVARADAVNAWRQWWQAEQRKKTVQPPSIYERNRPEAPRVIRPGEEDGAGTPLPEPKATPNE